MSGVSKLRTNHIRDIVGLARSGMSMWRIAEKWGVTHGTLIRWTRQEEAFGTAYQTAKQEYRICRALKNKFPTYKQRRLLGLPKLFKKSHNYKVEIEKMRKGVENGKSISEVFKEMGLPLHTASNWCRSSELFKKAYLVSLKKQYEISSKISVHRWNLKHRSMIRLARGVMHEGRVSLSSLIPKKIKEEGFGSDLCQGLSSSFGRFVVIVGPKRAAMCIKTLHRMRIYRREARARLARELSI